MTPRPSRRVFLVAAAAATALGAVLTGCATEPTNVTGSAGTTTSPSAVAADGSVVPGSPVLAQPRTAACPQTDPQATPVSGGLPDLVLPCLHDGSPVALAQLRGKPLVLNVWASWCGPCRAEMPVLESYRRAAQDDVVVLGLGILDESVAAAALLTELAPGTPSLLDADGQVRGALQVVGPPVTFFVSADGVVRYRHSGPLTDVAQVAGLAEEHLGVAL